MSEEKVTEAMETRFDGVDKFDIVQELLELEARQPDKELVEDLKFIAGDEWGQGRYCSAGDVKDKAKKWLAKYEEKK